MDLLQSIQAYAKSIPADFKEKKGSCDLSFTVAERKAFLSKQKLTYQAKFRIDDPGKNGPFCRDPERSLLRHGRGRGFSDHKLQHRQRRAAEFGHRAAVGTIW